MSKPRVIAFYLPQYHPTPHNDEWWGKGFTEWTNVAKAKKLYPGHYQPKIPADLGFYDLRLPEVREQQAELAREAGIEGFCYYHYWFEDGKEELEFPFKEVLRLQKPDFPFCLCWANESWHSKLWNLDGTVSKKLLIEQKYLGESDHIKHFYSLKDAFMDNRYIRIDGKPIFMIYNPDEFVDLPGFFKLWRNLAKENGIGDFFFIGYSSVAEASYKKYKQLGFDAICSSRIGRRYRSKSILNKLRKFFMVIFRLPFIYSYKEVLPTLVSDFERTHPDVFPTLVPNWDHTPRSGRGGYLYQNCTPDLFIKHVREVFNILKNKSPENQICFLKSWNEWGEGNYMEPDLRYGKGFIYALKKAKEEVEAD